MHDTRQMTAGRLALAGAFATVLGCGGGGGDDALPTGAPTTLERVADDGFSNAGAVAVSPDGETFYVSAYGEGNVPTIFTLDVAAQQLDVLHAGMPLLYPSDVATSCDGATLFVADMGAQAGEYEIGASDTAGKAGIAGGLYTIGTDGGTLTKLEASGIARAAGVVVSTSCDTLYVGGWTDMGTPAVFTVPTTGGGATVLLEGAPLVSPAGIHVDANDVAWVMDHGARGSDGEGSLFAIDASGKAKPVLSGLGMGRIGGVSLVPGGVTAVIPASDGESKSFLLTANTETGSQQVVDAPELQYPTGVAAAKNAPVMAVATENAIYSATFE